MRLFRQISIFVSLFICLGATAFAEPLPLPLGNINYFLGAGLVSTNSGISFSGPNINFPLTYSDTGTAGGLVSFSERFVGQTAQDWWDEFSVGCSLGENDPNCAHYDKLDPDSPTGILTLANGSTNNNLAIWKGELVGVGPRGYSTPSAPAGDELGLGEGSFAVLFDEAQSEFELGLVGGNGGSFSIALFMSDGTLLDGGSIGLPGDLGQAVSQTFGFSHAAGSAVIKGFSIWNTDLDGIGLSGLKFTASTQTTVPEPSSLLLLVPSLLGLAIWRGRRRN